MNKAILKERYIDLLTDEQCRELALKLVTVAQGEIQKVEVKRSAKKASEDILVFYPNGQMFDMVLSIRDFDLHDVGHLYRHKTNEEIEEIKIKQNQVLFEYMEKIFGEQYSQGYNEFWENKSLEAICDESDIRVGK